MLQRNGSQHSFTHGSTASTVDSSSCTNSEKIYHSTLRLQQNMTFPGNIDMTVQFICGISFATLVDDLFSTPTGNLTFAGEWSIFCVVADCELMRI